MHILLTRPLEDCSEMIVKFKSLGHQVSHLPLLNIEKINYEKINFSDYGGIIFTSANAVKYLDNNKLNKNIYCFCVGNVTEKKARSAGFQNTIAAEGNVLNLK
jgi:uroporphyrinogen-III synthase